jgi:hypothetical protein
MYRLHNVHVVINIIIILVYLSIIFLIHTLWCVMLCDTFASSCGKYGCSIEMN